MTIKETGDNEGDWHVIWKKTGWKETGWSKTGWKETERDAIGDI